MTNEEMERAIEFLLDHHAKFSGDMDKLKEMVVGLVQVVRHHDDRIEVLTESVKQTTDNLNALIRIVEGHVSNHP